MSRLILVDDDQLVRASAGLFFEGAGWTVDLAADAAQAIAHLGSPFDAMICDLHLSPRRSSEGLIVLEAARRAAPKAILVLLSGEGSERVVVPAPDAMLMKPVRLPQLQKILDALLAQRA